MIAKRLAILTEVVARLQTHPGIAEVQINASGDPSRFPAVFIVDGGQSADSMTEPGVTRYTMALSIEGFVAGGDGFEATGDLNALYLAVVETMMAEPPLGGLAEEITEGASRFEVASLASERRLAFSTDYEIVFPADRYSPAA